MPVCFVGHPLVEQLKFTTDNVSSKKILNLPPNKKIIALLPGSRKNEVARHMPVLSHTIKLLLQKNPQLHFIIPVAETLNEQYMQSYLSPNMPITFTQGQALTCMSAADFVIVASGTASLECALLNKPMCIIYKSSFLTYLAAMKLIKVKFLGLCNLLVNQMIVPEFLQYDCVADEITSYLLNFAADEAQPQKMIKALSFVKETLSPNTADCTLFELVQGELA